MFDFYLCDKDATMLHDKLDELNYKLRNMAKDDPNSQINIWYVIDIITNLRKMCFFGFNPKEEYESEDRLMYRAMDIVSNSSDFTEIKRRINAIKPLNSKEHNDEVPSFADFNDTLLDDSTPITNKADSV